MSQPTWACPTCQTPLPGMASFCYVCGTATPAGLNAHTGEVVTTTRTSGIGPADLVRKLQRALGPGYQLQERIGAGGFAEVFRARDLRLKRDLAVKVLRPDLGLSPDLVQRFRREAETIATLRNAHIVPVYDIGEAQGLAFIIMPLVVGESLRQILDRDGAMAPAEVARILREASLGLAAAHDAGIIHRDVKPENIMLEGRDKRVLLMDFGIAKAMGLAADADPASSLTTTGIIIGTPQYMSPEQASADRSIDARSDQYSLAVVGYRMLAGELPFGGQSTRAVLYQQLVATPAPIETKVAGVPSSLSSAIQRAMAKEPAERFPDMLAFAAAIDADPAASTAPTVKLKAAPKAGGKTAPRRGVMIGAAAIVLAGALAAAALLTSRGQPRVGATAPPPKATATQPAPSASPGAAVPGTATIAPKPPVSKDSAANRPSTPTSRVGGPAALTPAPSTGKPGTDPKTAARRGAGPNAAVTKGTQTAAAPTCTRYPGVTDYVTVAPVCLAQANAGNVTAQRILGMMYDKGNGVPTSPSDAVIWYRKAAGANDAEAQYLLSQMLDIGRGAPANPSESILRLRLAAAAGLLKAQQLLAYRLETGSNVKKNEPEAVTWYRRAAEAGDPMSQQKLADDLARGRGVTKNEAEALEWYRKAADQGSATAAWQAAQMYFKGRGTAKDDSAGMRLLRTAAEANVPDAVKELKKRTGQ